MVTIMCCLYQINLTCPVDDMAGEWGKRNVFSKSQYPLSEYNYCYTYLVIIMLYSQRLLMGQGPCTVPLPALLSAVSDCLKQQTTRGLV